MSGNLHEISWHFFQFQFCLKVFVRKKFVLFRYWVKGLTLCKLNSFKSRTLFNYIRSRLQISPNGAGIVAQAVWNRTKRLSFNNTIIIYIKKRSWAEHRLTLRSSKVRSIDYLMIIPFTVLRKVLFWVLRLFFFYPKHCICDSFNKRGPKISANHHSIHRIIQIFCKLFFMCYFYIENHSLSSWLKNFFSNPIIVLHYHGFIGVCTYNPYFHNCSRRNP